MLTLLGALAPVPRAVAARPDTLRLSIGDAARLAAERSAVVAASRFQTARARAVRSETGSVLWPQLSGHVEDGERTINIATFGFPTNLFPGIPQVIGPIRTIDIRGYLEQRLFDWSAIQRLRGAGAEVRASRVREEAVRDSVADLTAVAYVEALRAEGERREREADRALAEALLQVAEAQLAAGVGVRLDVTRAEAQLARTRAALVAAEAAAEQMRLLLLRTLSLPPEITLVLSDPLGATLAPVPPEGEAVQGALVERSELRALGAEIRAEEIQVSAIRAERLPYLSFYGDNGWIGTHVEDLPRTYTYYFRLSIPIFNGGARRARIQEQEAQVRALEALRLDLRREVAYEVRSAYLQLTAAEAQVGANEAALRLAEAEVAEAEARFRAGVAGSADAINAALRLSDARTAYIDALAGYQAAQVMLARARGVVRELP